MVNYFTLVVGCFLCLVGELKAQIVINEVASRGDVADDDGNNSDWIELYNAGDESVNMFNFALSDEATNPLKWKFPALEIASGELMLVLANGDGIINEVNHWETAVLNSAIWKYLVPSTEPSSSWNTLAFDASAWTSGDGGIGYGDLDDETDIGGPTPSLYMRKLFTVTDTNVIANAILHVDYDDAFVAYLNGTEIARSGNILGTPPAYNDLAFADHEAGLYAGFTPEAFSIPAAIINALLLPGDNVLSLQIHNSSAYSSDLSSSTWLSFGISTSAIYFAPVPTWFPVTSVYNHTNFSISNTGETIYLSDAEGVLIDQKNTGYLDPYHSIARIPNGTANWCITKETTPQFSNNGSTCYEGYEALPVFSITSGLYSGTQTIELSTTSASAIIHYSLNGEEVTALSPIYSDGLTIDTSSVVSAKCFSSGFLLPGKMVKNTYLINEGDFTVPIISISTNPGSLFDIDTGIYVFGPDDYSYDYPYYGANFWESWEEFSHISYFDKFGVEQWSKDCGLEIHGGWSRAENQRSFRIDFKNEYDGDLNFQLFEDKPSVTQFNNFNLRNGGQHVWASKMQDAFLARIMKNTHIDYEGWQPCVVFLNGTYWGLYEIREKADEHFAESNYGIDANTIDLLNGWTTLAGSDTGFYNLIDWAIATPANTDAFLNGFKDRVDLENYIDYYIGQIYYQNVDFGGYYWGLNNIKFWREQNGGKWRHIMYDLDGAMGWFGSAPADNYINLTRSPGVETYNSILFDRILDNDTIRHYFVNRFADLINTIYKTDHMTEIAYQMRDSMSAEIERQYNRWGAPYYDDWIYYIDAILDYNVSRFFYARQHINTSFSLGGQKTLTFQAEPEGAGFIKISTIIPDELPWSGVYFKDVPITITAIPNPGYTFVNWEDNLLLPDGAVTQSVTFDPTLSITFTANFIGSAVEPNIVVTEINYNSEGSLNTGDWVEIYNRDTISYNLSNWKLSDNNPIDFYALPFGTILEPNQYLVIAQSPEEFLALNATVTQIVGGFNFSFSNNGDSITLRNLNDALVINMQYTDSLTWPKGADGTGRTLELKSVTDNPNLGENWFDGCILGSPGQAYINCNSAIVFSEINYNSSTSEDAGDWIELWNTTDETIAMSQWKFADKNDTLLFAFPNGFFLEPNQRFVLANTLDLFTIQHDSVTTMSGPFLFGLDGSGEELRLFNENGILQFSVIYNDKLPWPIDADGAGKTLELNNEAGKMNEAENWFAGCPEGSPGTIYDATCGATAIITQSKSQFLVFPNPAKNTLTIQFSTQNLEGAIIQLLDATGNTIQQLTTVGKAQITIQRNQLTAGIYTLKVITEHKMEVQKIVFVD